MCKLYIAVLEEVPREKVPLLVAHSVLGAHLKFQRQDDYFYWINESFKKVVVCVNRKEFNKIREMSDVYEGYESTILDSEISCLVVCPRDEYPNVLKYSKLYK